MAQDERKPALCHEGGLKRRGLLVVLSGPSGVGKNTLLNEVLGRAPGIRYSISATTRPPRPGERDGVNYFFMSKEEFFRRVQQGELLEWAEVYGHFYGTPRSYVEENLSRGVNVALDIDIQGARQIRKTMPEGVFVFLLPPSWEALVERIRKRGQDSQEAIERRLDAARHEVLAVSDYDYVILNDDLDRAANELLAIVTAEERRVTRNDCREYIEAHFPPPHRPGKA